MQGYFPPPPAWPSLHRTMVFAAVMGVFLIVYGVLVNFYSGKIQADGRRYEPSLNLRTYSIVIGILLLLLGFFLSRY
jgi:multisubunit Na+/H+ antiporter MnhB subunit